jgi:hypothetical protein
MRSQAGARSSYAGFAAPVALRANEARPACCFKIGRAVQVVAWRHWGRRSGKADSVASSSCCQGVPGGCAEPNRQGSNVVALLGVASGVAFADDARRRNEGGRSERAVCGASEQGDEADEAFGGTRAR